MILAKVHSMTTIGLDSEKIEVELDLLNGLPRFTIVGLGDTAVQESRERVRSAIKNSGFAFPVRVIVANLAPADVRKAGPSFDLPIAIGILIASEQLEKTDILNKSLFIGELSLNGKLRHTNGILPIVLAASKMGFERIFLPKIDAKEASIAGTDLEILGADSLKEVVSHLQGENIITPQEKANFDELFSHADYEENFASIKGQEHAKRALEIAAAGSHNVLMNGSPGAGKTLMARAFRTILPRLTKSEALEVTKIFSIANLLPSEKPLITTRPFRTVHHTASGVSIVGGGRNPHPGEISLAHRGVLFLDELAEFPTQVLEVLRQPLEDRKITVSRAQGSTTFPAHFTLIAAMNPCPCGYYNVPNADRQCTCSSVNIARYNKKISGPLLDRIDLFAEISPVKFEELKDKSRNESSEKIRERVQKARDIQTERFKNDDIKTNSEMNVDQIEKYCTIDEETENLLKQAMRQFSLSARGYHRILKAARTIADLENTKNISLNHVAEALQFRPKIEE